MDDSTETYTTENSAPISHYEFIQTDFTNNLAQQILDELYRRQLTSMIVEGGTKTLQLFIDSDLWDECRIETGAMRLNADGIKAPEIKMKVTDIHFYGQQKIEIGIPL